MNKDLTNSAVVRQNVLNNAAKNGHTLTIEEVYRMLFGTEIKEDKYLDRPLGKMKYDILHDMGVV